MRYLLKDHLCLKESKAKLSKCQGREEQVMTDFYILVFW